MYGKIKRNVAFIPTMLIKLYMMLVEDVSKIPEATVARLSVNATNVIRITHNVW